MREHPELRVGDLYIVTHANADGDLLFPLYERDADRRVTYPELAESLSAHAEGYRLGGQIDARTTIRIKGCALGQSRGMVELIDQALGAGRAGGRADAPAELLARRRRGGGALLAHGAVAAARRPAPAACRRRPSSPAMSAASASRARSSTPAARPAAPAPTGGRRAATRRAAS
jgi:hypothetical protein